MQGIELSRRRLLALGTMSLLVGVGIATPAAAIDQALVDAANKEGTVVVYGDPSVMPALIKNFNKAYPNIRVNHVAGGGWEIFNRYLAERKAGKSAADVLYTSEDTLLKASDDGVLDPYRPAEAANYPDWAAPKDAHYVTTQGQLFMPMYNEDGMGDKPLPTDWFDYANPKPEWQSMIAMSDPRNSAGSFALAATLYQNFGPEKAGTIFEGFKKAGVELVPNMGLQVAKMQSGERPLGFGNTVRLWQMWNAGAPIKTISPSSGMVAQWSAIALPDTQPHPNAARLFMEWVLGAEGQDVLIKDTKGYSPRNGAATPERLPNLSDVKILKTDLRASLKDQKAIIDWWRQAMGVQ